MPTRIQYVHKEAKAIIQGTPTEKDWMTIAKAFQYNTLLETPELYNQARPATGLAQCLNNFGVFAALRQQLHLIPLPVLEVLCRLNTYYQLNACFGDNFSERDAMSRILELRRKNATSRYPAVVRHYAGIETYEKILSTPQKLSKNEILAATMYGAICQLTDKQIKEVFIQDSKSTRYYTECLAELTGQDLNFDLPNVLPNLKTLDIERCAPFYHEIKAAYTLVPAHAQITDYETMLADMAQTYIRQQAQQKNITR